MRILSVAGIALLMSLAGFGQPGGLPQAFEVASVKVSQIGRAGGEGSRRERVDHTPGSLTMRNVSMKSAIGWAYTVKSYQVSGPAWLETERYDINGKAAGEVGEDQLRLMLQTLLTDRFKLTFHREEKVLPVYALVVGKGGPKFKESETQGEMVMQPGGRGKFSGMAQRLTMAQAVDMLSQAPLGRPVVDETGLKGRYDITIDVAAYLGNEAQMKEFQADPTQLIFAVIQEQLGLKLESKKTTVQMLIVDGAEKAPTEN
jgi:uncharacterized protein (TIGR03435 family)